jgi:hypothetical protein
LLWLGLLCNLPLSDKVIEEIPHHNDMHLMAILVQAFLDGKISKRPRIRFSSRISSSDRGWLLNLVARAGGFVRASFSGNFAEECEHVAKKHIRLLDFESHISRISAEGERAIANVRFGYEDFEEDEDVSIAANLDADEPF